MRTIPENDGPGPDSIEALQPGELILVTGGAASGKSEYAEKLAVRMHEERPQCGGASPVLWYAATMHADPADEETAARIRRHRKMRAGRGFETIEQELDIGELAGRVRAGDTVLLEDLSNLLANEMFLRDNGDTEETLAGGTVEAGTPALAEDPAEAPALAEDPAGVIAGQILGLVRAGIRIVAVGNRISEDVPGCYEEGTASYIEQFQKLQRRISEAAEQVVEVVCGIPVKCK